MLGRVHYTLAILHTSVLLDLHWQRGVFHFTNRDPVLTFNLHGSEINSYFAENSVSSSQVVICTFTV